MNATVRITDRDTTGAGLPLKVAQAADAAATDGWALLASSGAAVTVVHDVDGPRLWPASLLDEPWTRTARQIIDRLRSHP